MLDAAARHVGSELDCAWNAFTLQTLGDKMLEAGAVADPPTMGFVPPVTFGQVKAYRTEVQRRLGYAGQAAHDPGIDLPAGTLPGRRPGWSPVEPCPRARRHTLARRSGRTHLGTRCARGRPRLTTLQGQLAQALSRANYTASMYRPGAPLALHKQVEERAKAAIEDLLSYPALLDKEKGGQNTSARRGGGTGGAAAPASVPGS